MKKTALLIAGMFVAVSFTACNNNNAADKISEDTETKVTADAVDNAGTPVFAFDEEKYDFGTINEGDIVEHEFTFTNTGDAPLIITSATGSCGCTVPEKPNEPIAPGESSKIKVSFNSTGKPGNQQKTVTINANTVPATKLIYISAQVTPKEPTAETAAETPAQS